MNTTIRQGKTRFYGDQIFSHGISRSGYFNKREAEELELYGQTLVQLANGTLEPCNEEEETFVFAISNNQPSDLYSVKLWQKYQAAIHKSKTRHGFAKSNLRTHFGEDFTDSYA